MNLNEDREFMEEVFAINGNIFMVNTDGSLTEMRQEQYDSERLLQNLLIRYPNLLAGDQINSASPRKWLLVSREMPVSGDGSGANRWSLDHLFLDQDAVPTFVEVKRSTDGRIRREVVGQMLDYAANAVVYWPADQIRSTFEGYCHESGNDPDERLLEFLEDSVEEDVERYWAKVRTNIQAERIRLIFVADEIPSELQRIVEFLNGQMSPAEVFAVEIRQFASDGVKTMVPRVMGLTVEAQSRKQSEKVGVRWNSESFFEELEDRVGSREVKSAKTIFDWSEAKVSNILWGKGSTTGSFVPTMVHRDREHPLFAVRTNGMLELYFYWYKYKAPFDSDEKRLELLKRLNAIEGVSLPEDRIDRKPNIPLHIFAEEEAMKTFFRIFDWVIDVILAS